jgi:hypothetical protein
MNSFEFFEKESLNSLASSDRSSSSKRFVMKIDPNKYPFRHLNNSKELLQEFRSNLREHLACSLFTKPTGFEIHSNNSYASDTNESTWRRRVDLFLENYKSRLLTREIVNFQLVLIFINFKELEKRIQNSLLTFNSIDYEIRPAPDFIISIEGLTENVQNAKSSLNQLLDEIRKSSETICENVNYDEHVLALLKMENLVETCVTDGVDLNVEFKANGLKIEGKKSKVNEARQILAKTINRLCEMSYEFERNLAKYLTENSEFMNKTLADNRFKCALHGKTETKLTIKSLQSNRHISDCHKFLVEKYTASTIDFDAISLELIRSKHLNKFIAALRQTHQASFDLFRIYITASRISIAGEKTIVDGLCKEVQDFLVVNSVYETVLSGFSLEDLEYLKTFASQELGFLVADFRNSLDAKVDIAEPLEIDLERKIIILK